MMYFREVYKARILDPYKLSFIGLLSPLRGEEKRKSETQESAPQEGTVR
jgi:hypothetical protein